MITSQDGTTGLKPEAEWSDAEDNEALGNYKDLNAFSNGVNKNMFSVVNTCTKAKNAW